MVLKSCLNFDNVHTHFKNIVIYMAVCLCVVLVFVARHSGRRKIQEIWHGRVYWENATNSLRLKRTVSDIQESNIRAEKNGDAIATDVVTEKSVKKTTKPNNLNTFMKTYKILYQSIALYGQTSLQK